MKTSLVKALTYSCLDYDRAGVKPLERGVSIEHPGAIQGTSNLIISP